MGLTEEDLYPAGRARRMPSTMDPTTPNARRGHLTPQPVEGFTEETLFKVYDSLRAAGLTEEDARDCINDMQNKGLLFRERIEPKAKTQICRGELGEERTRG